MHGWGWVGHALGIMSGMKDWPPKPGSTVMTSTMSTSGTRPSTASGGVPGLRAMPTLIPAALICAMRFLGSPRVAIDSMWKDVFDPLLGLGDHHVDIEEGFLADVLA